MHTGPASYVAERRLGGERALDGREADKREFERLLTPLLDVLYGAALRMTGHHHDAEDLVQDTVVKAFRFFHRFERGTNFKAWLLRRIGAFSIFREGLDREALRVAIRILVEARRPLVIFPEGIITRTNDRLGTLQEGVAFIARTAAKQRAQATPPGQVVIHPVALKYFFEGDLAASDPRRHGEVAALPRAPAGPEAIVGVPARGITRMSGSLCVDAASGDQALSRLHGRMASRVTAEPWRHDRLARESLCRKPERRKARPVPSSNYWSRFWGQPMGLPIT